MAKCTKGEYLIDTNVEFDRVLNSEYIKGLSEHLREPEIAECFHKAFICVRMDEAEQIKAIHATVQSFNPSGRLGVVMENTAHFDATNKLRMRTLLEKIVPMLRLKIMALRIPMDRKKNPIIAMLELRPTRTSHIFIT